MNYFSADSLPKQGSNLWKGQAKMRVYSDTRFPKASMNEDRKKIKRIPKVKTKPTSRATFKEIRKMAGYFFFFFLPIHNQNTVHAFSTYTRLNRQTSFCLVLICLLSICSTSSNFLEAFLVNVALLPMPLSTHTDRTSSNHIEQCCRWSSLWLDKTPGSLWQEMLQLQHWTCPADRPGHLPPHTSSRLILPIILHTLWQNLSIQTTLGPFHGTIDPGGLATGFKATSCIQSNEK